MADFAACEREAARIVAARLAEPAFRARIERRADGWGIGRERFVTDVATMIAIALHAARSAGPGLPEGRAAAAALAGLRAHDDVALFAALPVLPAEPGGPGVRIRRMRLLSAGIGRYSPVLWEKLRVTAVLVLEQGE